MITKGEQGGEQMPNPACFDALKRENRSEVLQDALRAVHEQREASTKPAQVRDEAEDRENKKGERGFESVRQHFVLSARDGFLLRPHPFYSPSRGRLAFNS